MTDNPHPNDPHRKLESLDVTVVSDETDKFSKRLGIFAIGLLIFLIGVLTLIQSGKNGENIKNKKPTVITTSPSVIIKPSPVFITASPNTVSVPGSTKTIIIRPTPESAPQTSPKPSASPKPSPKPTRSASPTPKPVRSIICRVICK